MWAMEDCRHVSGSAERFLLDHGETVVRVAPHLMAEARTNVRERGKSDPIDALAVARAAQREGIENLPTARLAGVELEIRVLHLHHKRLIKQRTALTNDLPHQLQELVTQTAPHLIAQKGIGVIVAAQLIGEIAGIDRFAMHNSRGSVLRAVPVSSGRTDRHRLDRGGNRQLNNAIHTIALSRARYDPQTAIYIARQRQAGKTQREAMRSPKRHLVRWIYRLLTNPNSIPDTICLT
ncbi:MAG TPA: transposase [Solirubrobacteraceae bacterium]|nr:transposase [Solirubrobacteraceae bacterium]